MDAPAEKLTLKTPQVVAVSVSLEDYMERYAANHCEWVEGTVIHLTPAELHHNNIIYFLHQFFEAYFELRPIGKVVGQPFMMRLPLSPIVTGNLI